MEISSFRKVFGDSPMIKLLDFFLAERGLYDYSLTEISENSEVAWTTLHRIFPKLIEMSIVKQTREIGRAKMYAVNEAHPIIKELVALDKKISQYFIKKELEDQKIKVHT